MPLIDEPPYGPDAIPEHPQCAPQPIKVIHVGAGASGILFAHKAEKMLKNYELVIYEKNDVIGGTWYENR
jgi:cation diffusion facilitator CzcD-associated flavoprotein CzcO